MKHRLFLAPIALLAMTLPAAAGQPDVPGRPGIIVNDSRTGWQNGAKSGWGQHVADLAGPGGSLGQHIQTTDPGPNPANDEGKGND